MKSLRDVSWLVASPATRAVERRPPPGGGSCSLRGRRCSREARRQLGAGGFARHFQPQWALARRGTGAVGHKERSGRLDHAELVRILHGGRARMRENWEARQLEAHAGTQTEA
jgi:hypothetical protein